MIGIEEISEIVKKIAAGYKPDKIILIGSYAAGTPNENSDLDLIIIKDSKLPRPERTIQVRKLIFGSMVPIDLIVYTPEEIKKSIDNQYSFIFKALKTGKTLYERAS